MILSAYERKGYAKLLRPEDINRFPIRAKPTSFTPGRTTNESFFGSQTVALQPDIDEDSLFRFAKASIGRGIQFGLRRVLPRLAPIIGWGILAKDIYDIVTD